MTVVATKMQENAQKCEETAQSLFNKYSGEGHTYISSKKLMNLLIALEICDDAEQFLVNHMLDPTGRGFTSVKQLATFIGEALPAQDEVSPITDIALSNTIKDEKSLEAHGFHKIEGDIHQDLGKPSHLWFLRDESKPSIVDICIHNSNRGGNALDDYECLEQGINVGKRKQIYLWVKKHASHPYPITDIALTSGEVGDRSSALYLPPKEGFVQVAGSIGVDSKEISLFLWICRQDVLSDDFDSIFDDVIEAVEKLAINSHLYTKFVEYDEGSVDVFIPLFSFLHNLSCLSITLDERDIQRVLCRFGATNPNLRRDGGYIVNFKKFVDAVLIRMTHKKGVLETRAFFDVQNEALLNSLRRVGDLEHRVCTSIKEDILQSRRKQRHVDDDEIDRYLRSAFQSLDKFKSGTLCEAEVHLVLRNLGVHATAEELRRIVRQFDRDGHQRMDYGEYCEYLKQKDRDLQMISRKISEWIHHTSNTKESVLGQFVALDGGQLGTVQESDFQTILGDMSLSLTEPELVQLARAFDRDGLKNVDYVEFVDTMILNDFNPYERLSENNTDFAIRSKSAKTVALRKLSKALQREQMLRNMSKPFNLLSFFQRADPLNEGTISSRDFSNILRNILDEDVILDSDIAQLQECFWDEEHLGVSYRQLCQSLHEVNHDLSPKKHTGRKARSTWFSNRELEDFSFEEMSISATRLREGTMRQLDGLMDSLSKALPDSMGSEVDVIRLKQHFQRADFQNSGILTCSFLERCLRNMGVGITSAEMDILQEMFGDPTVPNSINYLAFVDWIPHRKTKLGIEFDSDEDWDTTEIGSMDIMDRNNQNSRAQIRHRVRSAVSGAARPDAIFKTLRRADVGKRGVLEARKFVECLRHCGVSIPRKDIQSILNMFDVGQGCIDYNKFANFASLQSTSTNRVIQHISSILMDARNRGIDPWDVFRVFDKSGTGSVTHKDFLKALSIVDIDLSEQESRAIIQKFDADADGFISYKEFIGVLEGSFAQSSDLVSVFKPDSSVSEKNSAMEILKQKLDLVKKSAGYSHFDLQRQFERMDILGNGKISTLDFRRILSPPPLSLSDHAINSLLSAYQQNGQISYMELIKSITTHSNPTIDAIGATLRNIVQQNAKKNVNYRDVFLSLDSQSSGMLSRLDFRRALDTLGVCLSEGDLLALMDHFEVADSPGQVDYRSFWKILFPRDSEMATLENKLRRLVRDSAYIRGSNFDLRRSFEFFDR